MKKDSSRAITSVMVFVLVLGLTIFSVSPLCAAPVDLSTWSAVQLVPPELKNPGIWILDSNTKVIQTKNSDPTILLSPHNRANYTMRGTWRVTTKSDDDFIGIVFGYQDPSHFYVMDWKQGDQDQGGYGIAEKGFSIKKILLPFGDTLGRPDLWVSNGTDSSTILASNFDSSPGWTDNTLYDFELQFEPGTFSVRITQGETELWNVTVNDDSYTSGKFGLYGYSQESVEYSNIRVVPIPSAALLLSGGLAALFGITGKRRKKQPQR